jgi:hypothetical protein
MLFLLTISGYCVYPAMLAINENVLEPSTVEAKNKQSHLLYFPLSLSNK